MGITKRFRLAAGMLAAFLCAEATAEDVFVFGPVEKLSANGAQVTVLGQTFAVDHSQVTSNEPSGEFGLGAYVYIGGTRAHDGSLVADSTFVSKIPYVAGASEIFLSGVVSKFDSVLGVATIGNTQIYLLAAPQASMSFVSVGATVQIAGYQAMPSAQIWATEVLPTAVNSIQGTGVKGIQGTELESIQGTGKLSIQGTGVNSIQGTGKLSIQGTGVNSIQGTGKLSIQGTGVNSIQGTGKLSIQGTGVNSIQGTGKLSIQGTGVNSIQGTGKLSIQGTGVNSIQGTDKQSIQGTGINSIQGTGLNSIQGTGLNSIQGTGKLSIQGAGTNSIQGTGKQSY
jgi:hypothetical protein